MTLHTIVGVIGGELYEHGYRASVPGPGHSAIDRSVSLLLRDGRVLIHTFGATGWRAVRDDLRRRGLIDTLGRPSDGSGPAGRPARPSVAERTATAARLWDGAVPIERGSLAALHLRRRSVLWRPGLASLRFHPGAPVAVYQPSARQVRPALIARISDDQDDLRAIELTYLAPNGLPAVDVALVRKTIGQVPPGAAVRLAPAQDHMLVGEGVFTTFSAMRRFARPGWALRSAHNLSVWTPPRWVRAVMIAADRGAAGESAALRLRGRLVRLGLEARIALPEAPFGDWNEVEIAAQRQRREEGQRTVPERRGWASSPDGESP